VWEQPVLDDTTVAFLGTGCALIVGTAAEDGAPRASRGWGLDVLDGDRTSLRLLVDADDVVTLDQLVPGRPVAVTATDVRTLRSLQLKGESEGIEPGTAADAERAARYCDAFITAVHEADGVTRDRMERIVPASVAACRVHLAELFDQTPGPGAGSSMRTGPG
jgi:hypothetical protein